MRRTGRGRRGSRDRLAALIREESGQSLILIVLAMTLILALAAFSIDVALWQTKRHQAQVAADAAALAAANCLATRACTSTTSGGDAYTKATTYAAANGVPASSVTIANNQVTVATQTPAPDAFAGIFNVHPTAGARAVASYTDGVIAPSSVYGADCTNATNPPNVTSCSPSCANRGVTINSQGKTNINGAIESGGSVSVDIAGTDSIGPVQYGHGCPNSDNHVSVKGNASIANGPGQAAAATSYPTTYSGVWTSASQNECSASSIYTARTYPGSGNITVSGGSAMIPSTITLSGNSSSFGDPSVPVVMCASTSITIAGQKATLNDITLVAPNITLDSSNKSTSTNNFTITPDPNAVPDGGGSPAVALYDTSGATLDLGKNDVTINGAVYAPLAQILEQGNNGGSALLEGNTVTIDGNNSADGPSTTLTAFSGSDSLTQ